MPRNQGTSRKGKPKKHDRAAGMGRALQKAQGQRYRPRANGTSINGDGGMGMKPGATSIGVTDDQKKGVQSILEVPDLEDFLGQAEMAGREFASEKERFVVLDDVGMEYKGPPVVKWADRQEPVTNVVELSVPRRPKWDASTTPEQLDQMEKEAFLAWRRGIAVQEQARNHNHPVTPFEKNLDVWRQLWRVLERCSCILQIVDARNPLFYLSNDLRDYAKELGKPMILLLNKSDFLTSTQRQMWKDHFDSSSSGWDHVFFSARDEQVKLDHPEDTHDNRTTSDPSNVLDNIGVETPLTREQLLDWLEAYAARENCEPDDRHDNRIQFGMVGFPNVGKSSVINVLMGINKQSTKRLGVAAQPGKTKHFQTLILPDRDTIMFCDCPGLVFPSFVRETADLIAAGVYPIAQMMGDQYWAVIELIVLRIPAEFLQAHYGITLPTKYTAESFLSTYCKARGFLAANSGNPDHPRASRIVIKEYAKGTLLYCHPPPNLDEETTSTFCRESLSTALRSSKKLRERELLVKNDAEEAKPSETIPKPIPASEADGALDDFMDMLEPLESQPAKKKKNRPPKKWGKKGRKLRNSDPYGCHSNPDEELLGIAGQAVAPPGVTVNAGKYGQKGYTRPTHYAGARQAQASTTD